MNPPGTTTDLAVTRAEKRYIAALAEETRLRELHLAAVREYHSAVAALNLAQAAAWGSAEVTYEDAQAWLKAHPNTAPEQVPMGVIKAALRAHGWAP